MNFLEKKIGYTSGDNFLLSGNVPYVGYYNVVSGSAYQGKYVQDLQLTPTDTFGTNVILNSDLDFYREANEASITLPYSLADVTVQPNEFVTANVINSIFYRLNYNSIYLYSNCFIIDNNNIPQLTFLTYYNDGTKLEALNDTSDIEYSFTDSSLKYIQNIGNATAIAASFYNNENLVSLYICSSSSITILSGSFASENYTVGVQLTSAYIRDDLNNIFPYSNITDCVRTKNLLYVVDAGNKSVYKYDVTGLEAANLSLNRRIYVESFGSQYSNKNRFEYPQYITVDEINQRLFIYDSGTRLLTITDYDFNILSTNKIIRKIYTVKGIQYNQLLGTLHVISSIDDSTLYLHTFNSEIIQVSTVKVAERLNLTEKVIKFCLSQNNSNIFYIATNERVIKKFLNYPDKEIGDYNNNKLGLKSDAENQVNAPGGLLTCCVFGSNNNYDWVVICKNGRLIIVQDSAFYQTVSFSTSLSNYSYSDFRLLKDEYMQANYINKELYKLLKNVCILKNDIRGRFTTTLTSLCAANVNTKLVKVALNGYEYLQTYNYTFLDNFLYNYYIHENERVTPLSINRCLKNIHNLQSTLLQVTDIYSLDNTVQYVSADSTGKAVYSTLVLT